MNERNVSLTPEEANFIVGVLDRAQISRLDTAKMLIAVTEKIAIPFGGLARANAPVAKAETVDADVQPEVSAEVVPESEVPEDAK